MHNESQVKKWASCMSYVGGAVLLVDTQPHTWRHAYGHTHTYTHKHTHTTYMATYINYNKCMWQLLQSKSEQRQYHHHCFANLKNSYCG